MQPVDIYRKALEAAHSGRWADSLPLFAEAGDAGIDDKLYHYNYATALVSMEKYSEALGHLEKSIALDAEYIPALNNYAVCLGRLLRIADSEAVLRQILSIQPGHPEALTNLAGCLKDQGRTREAVDLYRQALAEKPGYAVAGSNLLLCLHSHETDGLRICAEHKAIAAAITADVVASPLPISPRTSGDRICVGFISPDFRLHSVAYFALPLIARLDKARFNVFCYSDVAGPDVITDKFAQLSENFISIFGRTDEDVCRIIREAGIDVLVDLAGHTSCGRPGLIARRAAAVQVNWLGYPGTTGIEAMDYRISDNVADPDGFESHYSEKLIRLPNGFLTYLGAADAPPSGHLPAQKNGYITFGSFNNASKIQPETIRLWAAALAAVSGSKMIIKSRPFGDHRLCGRIRSLFAREGIGEDRVELRGWDGNTSLHLAMYQDVDIALDTWPYNGTTTTCEALWMGVPVVSMSGAVHASRVGASILCSVGLRALATETQDAFSRMAAMLAADVPRLAGLRAGLRDSIASSALCNSRNFAVDFGDILERISK